MLDRSAVEAAALGGTADDPGLVEASSSSELAVQALTRRSSARLT
jgi:hypothetical protein